MCGGENTARLANVRARRVRCSEPQSFSNESPTQWVSFERVKLCLTRKKAQAALALSGTSLCAITHRSIVAAMSGSVLPTGMSTFMSTR